MADKEDWCNNVPSEFLRKLILSILKDHGLNPDTAKCKITTILASLWVSSVFKLTAHDTTKSVSLYFKCLPLDVARGELMKSCLYFKNEVMFYRYVQKAFMEFQKKKLPHIDESILTIPKCFRAETDGQNDVIVLEDMDAKGYVTLNRLKGLGNYELYLVMKELGRFHGFSYAMKAQDPKRFVQMKDTLIETSYCKEVLEGYGNDIFTYALEDAVRESIEHFSENSPYVKKLRRFIESSIPRSTVLCNGDPDNEPYNVITHGDLWISNFMFHYPTPSSSSEPDAVCFLDFQQARYTSPGMDVGRLLFVSMDKKTRDAHRQDLLRCYHNSLCEIVREFGCDPTEIFPYSSLEMQLKRCAPYTVKMAFFNLPHALDDHEDSDGDLSLNDVNSNPVLSAFSIPYLRKTTECRRRILEVIKEVVDCGYIE